MTRRPTEPLPPPTRARDRAAAVAAVAPRLTPPGMPAVGPPPSALILAAGASARMGRPKALLRLAGETFVERLCRALRDAGCPEVVVVVGAHATAIRPAVPGFARVVVNAEWRRGMRSSLRAGLRALPPGPVILTHVDRPLVDPQTLARLMTATGSVIPTCGGRPGHPVRLAADLRPRLLAGDDGPLSAVLAEARPRRLAVPDRGVLLNINTPADLRWLSAIRALDGRRPG